MTAKQRKPGMRSIQIVICLAAIFFFSVGYSAQAALPSEEEDSSGERGEVLAELRRYYADFSARDWEAFASHFWKGATITTVCSRRARRRNGWW